EKGAVDEVRAAKLDLGLRGLTLSPANQDFHPSDSRAMRVYEEAEKLGMPVLIHPHGPMTEASKLEFARPYLFDDVARSFPNLPVVPREALRGIVERDTLNLLGLS